MKIFAKKLKEAREKQGLTQKELAEELGIPLRTYTNYETLGRGNTSPSFELLVRLSELLYVTTDFLLGLGE